MVDYDFYTGTYRGSSILEAEWPAYEARAADQLARYKRIYTVIAVDEDAEKKAICAIETDTNGVPKVFQWPALSPVGDSMSVIAMSNAVWSNVDLHYPKSGKLVLATSEPVPVYE